MGIYDRDYYQDDQLQPFRPWDNRSMVSLLIIANAAVFLANFLFTPPSADPTTSNGLMQALSLRPEDLTQPWLWPRLVSYGFAHIDMFHILFNMVTLYFLGQGVESRYGKWEFFRFYVISIAVCGLIWSLTHSGGALLGASGGTTAVAMLFVFSFPQSTLYLYGALPVKAWLLGILIIIGNVVGSNQHVAYDVHLVGAGFAAVYFFGKLNFGFLSNLAQNARMKTRQARSGLRVHQPEGRADPSASKDDAESDRILDKIYREGQDSLTPRERAFMEQYSRRVRERREDGP